MDGSISDSVGIFLLRDAVPSSSYWIVSHTRTVTALLFSALNLPRNTISGLRLSLFQESELIEDGGAHTATGVGLSHSQFPD